MIGPNALRVQGRENPIVMFQTLETWSNLTSSRPTCSICSSEKRSMMYALAACAASLTSTWLVPSNVPATRHLAGNANTRLERGTLVGGRREGFAAGLAADGRASEKRRLGRASDPEQPRHPLLLPADTAADTQDLHRTGCRAAGPAILCHPPVTVRGTHPVEPAGGSLSRGGWSRRRARDLQRASELPVGGVEAVRRLEAVEPPAGRPTPWRAPRGTPRRTGRCGPRRGVSGPACLGRRALSSSARPSPRRRPPSRTSWRHRGGGPHSPAPAPGAAIGERFEHDNRTPPAARAGQPWSPPPDAR